MRRHASLFVFFAITVATVASFDTTFPAVLVQGYEPGWYAKLDKPDWAPSLQLLAAGWLACYLLIALAGWIVWRAQGLGFSLFLWFVQLGLAAAWPYLMFGQQRIDQAMDVAVALCLALAAFVIFAWRLRKSASALFVPYAAWVAFVTVLNWAILQLNA
jgi:benzodiazapine receptor